MADVKWIKIVTDIFDDEKMLLIESLPSADSIIVIWFKLLCLAGKNNNRGVFLLNDRIPYTDEMLATIFRRDLNTVRMALKTFEGFGMVELINDVITIPNWSKHQTLDQLEERKEYMKTYMQKYRGKQKLLAEHKDGCKVNSKVNSKANVNALEEDKIKNKNKDIYMDLSFIDDVIDKVKLTKEQYDKLCTKYTKELVDKEILALDTYIVNGKGGKYKDHYRTLNTWCNKNKESTPTNNKQQKQYDRFEFDD